MQAKQVLHATGALAVKALARMGRWIRERKGGDAERTAEAGTPDPNELLRHTLRRDLSLAAEHVQSIRCLLEITRQHQQPIPVAALTNLELVSKHLTELLRRIEVAGEATAGAPNVSASAPHSAIPSPLHPPRPSSGCHVFPSDISTPYG